MISKGDFPFSTTLRLDDDLGRFLRAAAEAQAMSVNGWVAGLLRREQVATVRPGIIIQSDLGNHAEGARTTVVIPLTTRGRAYAFFILIPKAKDNGLPVDSWANATQVFTVDKSRLAKRLGRATPAQMKALAGALSTVLEN